MMQLADHSLLTQDACSLNPVIGNFQFHNNLFLGNGGDAAICKKLY